MFITLFTLLLSTSSSVQIKTHVLLNNITINGTKHIKMRFGLFLSFTFARRKSCFSSLKNNISYAFYDLKLLAEFLYGKKLTSHVGQTIQSVWQTTQRAPKAEWLTVISPRNSRKLSLIKSLTSSSSYASIYLFIQ